MCGLCGLLGVEQHWTDGDALGRSALERSRRQERLQRVAICNKILAGYGLELSDWQGRCYLLKNRTGRSEILSHIAALWPAAEALAGRACDPLDPEVVAALERSD